MKERYFELAYRILNDDWGPSANHTCGDCAAEEGEFHSDSLQCDMEICPFCGKQLLGCGCCYDKLGIRDASKYSADTEYLPLFTYEHGLTPAQEEEWKRILEEKGRIRWICYPNMCARCGKPWPTMFHVPDEEWKKYIQPEVQGDKMLCEPCFKIIKGFIDESGE